MKKFILSSCLVAGTSVGAGMIALPMVLCKIGIAPTILLIFSLWFFMYLSGLLGLELNLRAGKGLPLGELGKLYSGPLASQIGSFSLMFLIYALLCAYLYGGASIFQSFFADHVGWTFSLKGVVLLYAFFLTGILYTSLHSILFINKMLLVLLLIFFGLLTFGLFQRNEILDMEFVSPCIGELASWTKIIPILSTAFGFQVILPILTNFCDKDVLMLKRSVFWGSLLPALVYIIWTLSTLGILYHYAPQEYASLIAGNLDVGQFIHALTETAAWPMVKTLTGVISIIAILKSSIGVGLGLLEAWQERLLQKNLSLYFPIKSASLGLTILPPLGISLLIPELFLKALSFAGMINVIIVIFLPLWLLNCSRAHREKPFYPVIQNKGIQIAFLVLGVAIVLSEVHNML